MASALKLLSLSLVAFLTSFYAIYWLASSTNSGHHEIQHASVLAEEDVLRLMSEAKKGKDKTTATENMPASEETLNPSLAASENFQFANEVKPTGETGSETETGTETEDEIETEPVLETTSEAAPLFSSTPGGTSLGVGPSQSLPNAGNASTVEKKRKANSKRSCEELGLCPSQEHADNCIKELAEYASNKSQVSPYTFTSSVQSYADIGSLVWTKTTYAEGKVFTMRGSLKIVAIGTDGKPRAQGGDNWAVFLHSPIAKVTGEVEDHLDGTYTAHFEVAEEATYDFIVQLSSGLNDKGAEVVKSGVCTLDEMRTMLHGQLDGITTVCAWEAIPVLLPGKTKPSFEQYKLPVTTKFPKVPLPICKTATEQGRWLALEHCTPEKCSGSTSMLKGFKWQPHIWIPFGCRYHMYSSSDPKLSSCLTKLRRKGPVIVGGDSVSKLGFGMDMSKISSKIWPGAVQLHSVYSLQTLYNVGNLGPKTGLTAKQKQRQADVARKEIVQRRTFFDIMKLKSKASHIIVGTGRHDIRNGQSVKDFLSYGSLFARDLGYSQSKGVKAFWLNTAAPQARQPTPINAERKDCELGHHTVICATGRDQCARFAQRFDRVRTMNTHMSNIFGNSKHGVIDTFRITNVGIKDWHDDNIHHHEKAGGMSKMQAQIAWNVICENLA